MSTEKKIERFGSPVDSRVISQINQRQSVLGSDNKTREQIQFATSNTSWVKLRSSVNKVTSEEAKQSLQSNSPLNTKGNSIPAQNYVLLGGTLNPESRTPRYGILRSPNSDNPNAGGRPASLYRDTEAYLNYQSTGIRPMPGVTGMTVKHKNTYGTLMEATVNFTVWSKEQLEDVELLYFRPGYTALLEWGHALYLDNSGNLKVASESMTVPEDMFFKKTNQMENIDNEIIKRRRIYNGNYQGMFGFITNFDWSFRPDGGYDCSVKISSRGIVLESLKSPSVSTQIPVDELPSQQEQEQEKREKDAEAFRSIFSYLDSGLKQYKGLEYSFNLVDFLSDTTRTQTQEARINCKKLAGKITEGYKNSAFVLNYADIQANGQPIEVFYTPFKPTDDEPEFWHLWNYGDLFWIDLKTFLSIINEIYLLKNPEDNGKSITFFSLAYGEKYKTYGNHFSLDPMTAMVPRIPSGNKNLVVRKDKGGLKSINSVMQSYALSRTTGTDKESKLSDIMNIMVSTTFLASEANRMIQASENGIGVIDFITSVLSGINKSFGGINNLGIFYDHDNCVYKIVDRGEPMITPAKDLPVINVTGLNNTVVDLKVQSKISSNISSQISIAAQGHSGTYGENLKSMLQWNAGALDRHITRKDQSPTGTDEQGDDKPTVNEALELAFEQFSDENMYKGNVNLKLWGQIANEASNYIAQQYSEGVNTKGSKFEPMPVPVTLDLKLLGISGIKIASTFTINKQVLPSKYHKYGFIVTGVDHEIGTDNKWYTNVKAQFYATGL